jgi:hypothetical protein
MNKIFFLAIFLISTSTMFAQSASKSAPASKGSAKYGMAGCGLGSLAVKNNDIMQIFAATSNGIYGNQTFGITTGTSNCTKDGVALKDKEQEIFVHTNYESLEKESAIGKGEKLSALASLLGCKSNELSTLAKKNYEKFFASKESSPTFFLNSIKEEINKDEAAKSACRI